MYDEHEEEDSSGWQLTESDPGVFTELLKRLGVPLIVDDLYSLDTESLNALQPIRALIFLFKWLPGTDADGGGEGAYDDDFDGFFARQVVNNACATLAVLNGICNIPSLEMASELKDLIAFTTGMDPESRGLTVTSYPFLREAHNALSPPSAVSLDGLIPPSQRQKEDAYHFVVYLPYAGSIYEFDGLKRAPIRHSQVRDGDAWVSEAAEVIQRRIATYGDGAVHFNLQALRDDPMPRMQKELGEAKTKGQESRVALLQGEIEREEAKRKRWDFENALRRHNHLGLIHALLIGLSKSGGLEAAVEGAKGKMKARREKAAKEGKEMEE